MYIRVCKLFYKEKDILVFYRIQHFMKIREGRRSLTEAKDGMFCAYMHVFGVCFYTSVKSKTR